MNKHVQQPRRLVHVCVHTPSFSSLEKYIRVHVHTLMYMYRNILRHNSLGHEWPSGPDVKQSPNVKDVFWPIPDLISYA